MAALTREQILQADDIAPSITPVEVPEWGGTAYVRALTGGERGRLEELIKAMGAGKTRGIVAAIALCDEDGKPLFTEADVEALEGHSARVLDRIMKVVDEVNLISKEAMDQAGKNSPTIPA